MHGSCLCGAVQFEATSPQQHSHACHCEMCRRWTGSALVVAMVPSEAVCWEGKGDIRTFRSSDWAERGWCDRCGAALFYRVTAEGPMHGTYFIALGLFDEPDSLPMRNEIYIDRKTSAYDFAGDHPRLTGAEFQASLDAG